MHKIITLTAVAVAVTTIFSACNIKVPDKPGMEREVTPEIIREDSLRLVEEGRAPIKVDAEYYSAVVYKDGTVGVSMKKEACDRLADEFGLRACISNAMTVKGLDGKCVQMMDANMGNEINPFLVMLTDKGSVCILSIIDAIFTGDMTSSGAMPGHENTKELKLVKDIDGQCVLSVSNDGKERDILTSSDITGYYLIADFMVYVSRDWTISLDDDVVGYHKKGSISVHDNAEYDGIKPKWYELMIGDRAFRAGFLLRDPEQNYDALITFRDAPEDFPLETGRPLGAHREIFRQSK